MRRIENRICSVKGCGKEIHARGWCHTHAQRARRNGGPLVSKPWRHAPPIPPDVRLWRRVDKNGAGGCWVWTGKPSAAGYGRVSMGGAGSKTVLAHRLAYELLVGPIPEGLTLDHLCRNTLCVNPQHLEPVTLVENIRRAHAARSTERHQATRFIV